MSDTKRSGAKTALLILFRVLFTGFAVVSTLFIFYNSLEIGMASAARSAQVLAIVNRYLGALGLDPLSGYAVRKLAHFTEFLILGFWWTLCLRVYTRRIVRHISWPFLLVLFTADIDETIQTFVLDRSGSIRDVWIDFSGGFTGIALALCVIVLLTGFWVLLGVGRHAD